MPDRAREAGAPRGRLRKSDRVRKRREYQRIQGEGRRVSLEHFVFVVALGAAAQSSPRLGITASRKVGGAVARARIRRLLREAFRATRDSFPSDADFVVIVKRAPPELRLDDVIAELLRAAPGVKRRVEEARRARRC